MDPSNRENLSFLFKYYALVKSKQEHDFPKVLLTLLTIEEGKAILTRLCNLASTLRTDNYRVSHIGIKQVTFFDHKKIVESTVLLTTRNMK